MTNPNTPTRLSFVLEGGATINVDMTFQEAKTFMKQWMDGYYKDKKAIGDMVTEAPWAIDVARIMSIHIFTEEVLRKQEEVRQQLAKQQQLMRQPAGQDWSLSGFQGR